MDVVRRDNGSIVIGWLTKLMVATAIIGLALFDTLSIGAAKLGASDDAKTAAEAASADFRQNHDVQSAYQVALDTLPSDSETIPARQFVVAPDGTVDLVLHRTTTTLVAHRIGPLKQYTFVTVHAVATPPTL